MTPQAAVRQTFAVVPESGRIRFFANELARLAFELGVPASAVHVLDVGCGDGARTAVPLGERGYSVTGVDSDAQAVARGVAAGLPPNVRLTHDPRGDLGFTRRFDAIVVDRAAAGRSARLLASRAADLLRSTGVLLLAVDNPLAGGSGEPGREAGDPLPGIIAELESGGLQVARIVPAGREALAALVPPVRGLQARSHVSIRAAASWLLECRPRAA